MKIEQSQWLSESGWRSSGLLESLGDSAQVVFLFGGIAEMEASGCLARVRAAYPGAHLCGCTTAGEIQGTTVRDGTVAVTAIAFSHTRVEAATAQIPSVDQSYAAGQQIAHSLLGDDLRHVFVLSEGLQVNGCELLRGINSELPEGVSVSGGFAGDGNRLQNTYVCCNGEMSQSKVVALGFYGDRLKVGLASSGGWDPFGPDRLITRSQNNVLYEFDGRSALALYKQYLGEHAANLPASGLMFPLQLRVGNDEQRVLRALLAVNEEEQSITFAGEIPERSFARLMTGNIEHLIDGAYKAAEASVAGMDAGVPEFSILVSCNGRRPVLKQRIEEEIEAVADALGSGAALTGFYSYGEIAPVATGGQAELHNQTMTVTTFKEV